MLLESVLMWLYPLTVMTVVLLCSVLGTSITCLSIPGRERPPLWFSLPFPHPLWRSKGIGCSDIQIIKRNIAIIAVIFGAIKIKEYLIDWHIHLNPYLSGIVDPIFYWSCVQGLSRFVLVMSLKPAFSFHWYVLFISTTSSTCQWYIKGRCLSLHDCLSSYSSSSLLAEVFI